MKQNEDHHLPNVGGNHAEPGRTGEDGQAMDNDNFSRYLGHIAHLDMSLECKIELLRVVHDMMRSFVDRAFGDDPVQLARKDGDEIKIARDGDSSSVVVSDDQNNTGDTALKRAFAKRADGTDQKEKPRP